MNSKLFLKSLYSLIPLNYSQGINKINKKYQSAAVACIIRIKQQQQENQNQNQNEVFLSLNEIYNNYNEEKNEIEMLFIKRTSRGGDRWSGDVAFPGGFLDINESDKQGVIREVYEELGLNLSNSNEFYWFGRLKDITLGHERTITPHLFCYLGKNEPILKIEPNEVADVQWINIKTFLNKSNQPLDYSSFHVNEFISRSQNKNVFFNSLISTMAKVLNCSTIYFPAIFLPINSNKSHWVLWGMTFGIVSNLFQIVNKNKPFFQHKLPFWFDNKLINFSISFWKKVLGGVMISRSSLIAISISSLFGFTSFSLYGLWNSGLMIFSS